MHPPSLFPANILLAAYNIMDYWHVNYDHANLFNQLAMIYGKHLKDIKL